MLKINYFGKNQVFVLFRVKNADEIYRLDLLKIQKEK